MGKTLVLAEKPSVGREIARVLGCRQGGNGFLSGPKYIVTWALGHLVELEDPEHYGKQYQTVEHGHSAYAAAENGAKGHSPNRQAVQLW